MTTEEYKYLLCAYLLIKDSEIHSKELDFLKKNSINLSEECKIEVGKIMSDDEDKIMLSDILVVLKLETIESKKELIEFLIQLAITDEYFHANEKNFIINTAKEFHINEVAQLIDKYESEITINYIEKKQSFYANIKEKLFKKMYDISDNEYFEQNLLEGNSFVQKVKEIAGRASNDLDLASEKMLDFNKKLEINFKVIESISGKIKGIKSEHKSENLVSFIDKLNNETKNDILNSIKINNETLEKKKYTVDYFTIAFLGRTKAGKSTFHKVITGEETDDVGVGKLRTTRYNRVFNWENIRVIDTPGIGAPGGKEDTDIARSIIDEADLVCYVVTNDAIQETEFNFLTELKDKNKPIFIILNYKENIEHPKRLEKFLKNPKAWLENKDDKSLEGHIHRIKEMVSKFNYDPSLIEIVPIHLLAAKLAKQDKVNQQLYEGSNISQYNKLIKQTIFRNGHLKKTQNIIDGCNYQTSLTYHKTQHDILEINKLLKQIKFEKKDLIKYFDEQESKTKYLIKSEINSIHKAMITDLNIFANNEYESNDLGKAWMKFVEEKGYYKTLNLNVEDFISDFQKKIQDRLKESLQDIILNVAKLDIEHIKVNTSDYKFASDIAFGIIGVGIAIVTLFTPIGWIGLVARVGDLVGLVFDSKETKIKKAVEKIINTIQPKIEENEKEILKNYEENFLKSSQAIKEKLILNFDEMIDGLEKILCVLNAINQDSKSYTDYFNKVLMFRSFEHMNKIKLKDILTEELVYKYLSNTTITRDKENLMVSTTYKLNQEELKQLNKALQLNITLN